MRMLRPLLLAAALITLSPFLAALDCAHAQAAPADISYAALNGKTIRSITIGIRDIFDEQNLGSLYRLANKLKINTQEDVVRRELLFSEGDKFDDFIIKETERSLRLLGFLHHVSISAVADGDMVDIHVDTQDTWTIIPNLTLTSGTGRQKVVAGVSESNLMGLGKRFEVLYEDDSNRTSYASVYEDDRFWGTRNRLIGAFFDRNDGQEVLLDFGRPFRSLVEPFSWNTNLDVSDNVGRLFENGDERFLFRQKHTDVSARYTMAHGDPKSSVGRYSLGYRYLDDRFSAADQGDFDDLGVDYDSVSHDPALLAENLRFSGPLLGYRQIEPDFISMNYIDRFDRIADYNLGNDVSVTGFLAPTAFGSVDDTFLLSANDSIGHRFSESSFIRGELGLSSRYDQSGLSNSLVRTEVKFYNVLGLLQLGSLYLGRHTLAAGFTLDYGVDLDLNREFLLGADNGLRGYEAQTFTGDKRMVLNFEDRVHIVDDAFKLISVGAAAFVDIGGSTRESLAQLLAEDMYSDVGVGLRFAFPRSTGSRVFRIDLAFPMREGPDGSGSFELRLILSGGQLFGSFLRSETDGPENANVGIGLER